VAETLTLAARIAAAMKDVGSIAKAGKNKDQGYAYQKAADIFAATQEAFANHGICLTADEDSIEFPDPLITKNGATMFIARARMAYTFRSTDTDETITVKHTGIGYDTSDKALNKAKTAAEKYLLKQTLLIGEDEDDGDEDTIEPKEALPCPKCGVVGAITKSKPEYGGGWFCWPKKGGCNARFDEDPSKAPSREPPAKAQRARKSDDSKKSAQQPIETTATRQDEPTAPASTQAAKPPKAAQPNPEAEMLIAEIERLIVETKYPEGATKLLASKRKAKFQEFEMRDLEWVLRVLTIRDEKIKSGAIKLE
jgi:hypothetical protein